MAAELIPADCIGMPLPILPRGESPRKNWEDVDHAFYTEERPELQNESGKALIYSRVQVMPRFLHERKHRLWPLGSLVPASETNRFVLVNMTEAGYVPEYALDLSEEGSYVERYISPEERRQYFHSGVIRPDRAPIGRDGQHYKQRAIGMFIAKYVSQQQLEDVPRYKIDDFIDETTPPHVKISIGIRLIREAIRVAVEPVVPVHREALKQLQLAENAPPHPFGVVVNVFTEKYHPDYLGELHNNLLQRSAA
ncbi:hypothetical protein BH23PAT1_BH23PAT1_0290 [soil metagenome]